MPTDHLLGSEDSSSSSAPHNALSEEPTQPSSPPSSPPGFPWEEPTGQEHGPKPPPAPIKSAFAILGKRKASDPPSRPAPPRTKHPRRSTAPARTQMQISLGQQVQKTCPLCGMEYIASSAEDRALHDRHHRQHAEGPELGRDFLRGAPALSPGLRPADAICPVDCTDPAPRKHRARAALAIAHRDLGAAPLPDRDLWHPLAARRDPAPPRAPVFRAYLYVRAHRCIGLLLTERIARAYRVREPDAAAQTHASPPAPRAQAAGGALEALRARREQAAAAAAASQLRAGEPLELEREAHAAGLGVSRVWTSALHRRQGIATALLDAAWRDYDAGRGGDGGRGEGEERVARGDKSVAVAFSQPTESGTRLARRWFGRMWGWSVYVD